MRGWCRSASLNQAAAASTRRLLRAAMRMLYSALGIGHLGETGFEAGPPPAASVGKQRMELAWNDSRSGRGRALVALIAAVMLGGCSAGGMSGDSFGERFKEAAATDTVAQTASAGAQSSTVTICPTVDVRPGTSSLVFNTANVPGAMGLRYQATLGQTSRECHAIGGNLTIKVGVQGRLIVGPAGGPGTIDVPLRLALVHEGPTPKTLWTKLYRIPVSIPEGAPHVTFTHVEEDLTVPMPGGNDIEAYVIYVGFDAQGAKEQPAKKPPARRRTQPTG